MKEIILSIIQEISSELFITYKQNMLLSDKKKFNKCYSAIYLLEDIAETFDSYKKCDESQITLGTKYLMIYGVLEALYMQQQALNDLLISLDYEEIDYPKEHPDLYHIRNVRNDVAGHPTSRSSVQYTTYLSRLDLSIKKIKYEESKDGRFIDFDILSNIDKQEKFVKYKLEELLDKLKQEKKEHIEEYKDDKLTDCFKMFIYAYEKIYSHDCFYTQNDSMGFDLVYDIIESLKVKLNKRYTNWCDTSFSGDIKFVEQIYEYLLSKPEIINEVNEENAFLKKNLLENMFTHIKELKEMAKEVDIYYENNFEF